MAYIEGRVRLGFSQAIRARRTDASAYVSLSERVGIPLALMRPNASHVLVAHLLTSRSKRRIAVATGYLSLLDEVFVFARPQERYLTEEMGLAAERVRFVFDKVDAGFFFPSERRGSTGYVLSVGQEQRDYRTLVDAVAPLGLRCVIVAGSMWSHRTLSAVSLPDGVEMRAGLSYRQLRELYLGASLVVVPVRSGSDYAAGVNTVLEAMACAKPVIVSDTPGLEGYVHDGVDGRLVAPGDPRALRQLIEELWEDRIQAERLGAHGRETVERGRTIEHFVSELARAVEPRV
jgi:glycosyltransferase involved in cell wall biosynthesis